MPKKEDFYRHIKIEDVTVADYTHAKRVCKDFEIKGLGEYHNLYVQSDTLLLADVKLPKKEDFYSHKNGRCYWYRLNLHQKIL